MTRKPKLTILELIEKMKAKGITFKIISEDKAKEIIENRNYYYRITSYRKNFPKNKDNMYDQLDFAVLNDLASIDSYLRSYLLNLALDIEHTAKTKLLTEISYNHNEDGYSIVQDFKDKYIQKFNQTIKYFRNNQYLKDMSNRRMEDHFLYGYF
ncbi:Abi family protein [Hutsoniella sourekii]|uniref:Abi family protein n=1 Tax=Hutsoniella sourekii TaxID=87650 RepID=UPI0004BC5774|nr:Abi family protein [Hutsoniella sourekii]